MFHNILATYFNLQLRFIFKVMFHNILDTYLLIVSLTQKNRRLLSVVC